MSTVAATGPEPPVKSRGAELREALRLLTVAERGGGTGGRSTACCSRSARSSLGLAAAVASSATTQDEAGRARARARCSAGRRRSGASRSSRALALALLVVADALLRRRWLLVARRRCGARGRARPRGRCSAGRSISDWTPLEEPPARALGVPGAAARGHDRRSSSSPGPSSSGRCGGSPRRSSCSPRSAPSRSAPRSRRPRSRGLRSGSAAPRSSGSRSARPQACRRPSGSARELAALGVADAPTCSRPSGSGSARPQYVGHDAAGKPLAVRVLGRDAQDTQRLARRWRSARLPRPAPGASPSAGSSRSSTRRSRR